MLRIDIDKTFQVRLPLSLTLHLVEVIHLTNWNAYVVQKFATVRYFADCWNLVCLLQIIETQSVYYRSIVDVLDDALPKIKHQIGLWR